MPGDTENDMEFVSQDEIDRLLNQEDAPSEEDASSAESTVAEDAAEVPVDEESADTEPEEDSVAGNTPEQGSSEDADLDQMLEEATDIDETAAEEPVDRVILEEVPDKPPPEAPRRTHVWALHKDFWIILSVACILGTGLNLLLWIDNKRSQHVVKPEILSFPVVDTAAVTGPLTFRTHPRGITLKGFLVPAPIERKDLTYITADVSIELTHSKAVSLIKAHAPFYRNIIYEVIKRMLSSLDKSKISEISLKIEVLKALNGSVPERSVRDVSVDTFVMF